MRQSSNVHWRKHISRILSIQSPSLGHKTFGNVLRAVSSRREDIQLDSFWADENRSHLTKIVRKLAEISVPILNKTNLDLRRARAEWSMGQMSGKLAANQIETHSYDALHFHTQTSAFGNAGLMRKIKTFITIDMTAFQVAREYNAGPNWVYRPNMIMERQVFSQAAHIITFSDWARKSVIADQHISSERVTTITPGVQIEKLPTPSFETRPKPQILFIGNDFARKGGHDLLSVFLQNFKDQAELHLVTNDEVAVQDPSVHIHAGVVAYSERWRELYRQSEIFVMVSRAEALGMVFQEAAASGLALIGTAVGGIPEMVTHGANGFVIPPGDRGALKHYLEILIENAELRETMRKASRQRALRDFNATKNMNRLLELMGSAPDC